MVTSKNKNKKKDFQFGESPNSTLLEVISNKGLQARNSQFYAGFGFFSAGIPQISADLVGLLLIFGAVLSLGNENVVQGHSSTPVSLF